jgi:hypothetical protein|tara:strand:- start:5209 stop:5430 length:222 start_codon:yes stop_codon:yes gene_type:complete
MSVDYDYLQQQQQALLEIISDLEEGDNKTKLRNLGYWVKTIWLEKDTANLNPIDEFNSVANGAYIDNKIEAES